MSQNTFNCLIYGYKIPEDYPPVEETPLYGDKYGYNKGDYLGSLEDFAVKNNLFLWRDGNHINTGMSGAIGISILEKHELSTDMIDFFDIADAALKFDEIDDKVKEELKEILGIDPEKPKLYMVTSRV